MMQWLTLFGHSYSLILAVQRHFSDASISERIGLAEPKWLGSVERQVLLEKQYVSIWKWQDI